MKSWLTIIGAWIVGLFVLTIISLIGITLLTGGPIDVFAISSYFFSFIAWVIAIGGPVAFILYFCIQVLRNQRILIEQNNELITHVKNRNNESSSTGR